MVQWWTLLRVKDTLPLDNMVYHITSWPVDGWQLSYTFSATADFAVISEPRIEVLSSYNVNTQHIVPKFNRNPPCRYSLSCVQSLFGLPNLYSLCHSCRDIWWVLDHVRGQEEFELHTGVTHRRATCSASMYSPEGPIMTTHIMRIKNQSSQLLKTFALGLKNYSLAYK